MKPLIMITNDDGICSEGLAAAVRAAAGIGEVLVVAPATQQTAMGRGYPRIADLGIIEPVDFRMESVQAYALHGSPGYCTAYGLLEIAEKTPDLVVSGINFGCNLGMSLTASGTLGAAFEAYSEGVPTIALSLETGAGDIRLTSSEGVRFQSAEKIAGYWMQKMLDPERTPWHCFLNINIPSGEIGVEAYRYTFLENQNYYILRRPPKRDWTKPFTMEFEIRIDAEKLHAGSDIQTVCQDRLTSVTPIAMDMTWNEHSRF